MPTDRYYLPPVHGGDINQFQVCLVDQSCGLDAAAGPLVLHAVPCDAAQFPIDARRKRLERLAIAVCPSPQKLRGLRSPFWRHRLEL